VAELNYLGIPL